MRRLCVIWLLTLVWASSAGVVLAAPPSVSVKSKLASGSVAVYGDVTVASKGTSSRRKSSGGARRSRPARPARRVNSTTVNPGCAVVTMIVRAPTCVTVGPGSPGSQVSRGAPATATRTYTISDVQHLPLPAGRMVVEPPGGYVLAEVPVNVYAADVGPTDLSAVVLGVPVVVRVTPVSWSWTFGDGGVVGPTSDPGGPYPAVTNTHTYERRGSYEIVMTTFYRAEVSVSGGPFQPIEGHTGVVGAPVTVQVLAGRTELRAG